jgi:uncharacterized OsmC-like protein
VADIVTATYVGQGRARIQSGERSHLLTKRTQLDQIGAGLCPVELVAASLAG